MICDSCKSEIPDDATKCAHCGDAVGKAATAQVIGLLIGAPIIIWWIWKYFIPWLQANGLLG